MSIDSLVSYLFLHTLNMYFFILHRSSKETEPDIISPLIIRSRLHYRSVKNQIVSLGQLLAEYDIIIMTVVATSKTDRSSRSIIL